MEKEQILALIEYLEGYKESKNIDQLKFAVNKTVKILKDASATDLDAVNDQC